MSGRILVVDDEKDILELLSGFLIQEGFQVETAEGGNAAIALFKSRPFEVVITDMRMPVMGGLAVMQHIKALDETVEVIILTAFAAVDNVIESFQHNRGAFDYLTKPLESLDALFSIVNKALESCRLKRENRALLERLQQAKKVLEDRVASRTSDLRQANMQLQHELNQRRQTETALQVNEARMRAILNTAVDAIVTCDENGIIESFNRSAEQLFGYDAQTVIGKNVNLLMPESFRGRHDLAIRNYLETGHKKIIGVGKEAVGLRKDGTTFPMELAVSEVVVNNKRIFTGIIRNITERKQYENALRESEERYRYLVERAEDIIYQTDETGHFNYFNPAAAKKTGFQETELVGKNYLDLVQPDYLEAAQRFYGIQFVKKIPTTYYEMPILSKDGKVIWIGQHVKLLMEGNEFKGFHAVARDITQQKYAEKVLAEARAHEVEIGSKIQRTLLLGSPPSGIAGLQIAALTIPSQSIDGDFYDFFKHSDQCIDLVLGDVMGKGVPAALLGAGTRTQFLRSMTQLISNAERLPEPEEIVQHVHNALVSEFIGLEVFVTLCYARFDLEKRSVSFVDCGHTKSIHYRPDTRKISFLEGENLPIGLKKSENYRQVETGFQPGDLFLFFSDGITEAQSPSGEFFDQDRLITCIRENGTLNSEMLIETVRQTVVEFSNADTFIDDLTCAAVRIERRDPGAPLLHLELEVSSELSNLAAIRELVRKTCQGAGLMDPEDEQIWQLELIVNEATANIINHAYHHRPGERILIETNAYPDRFLTYLHHWGDDFDRGAIPPPVLDGTEENGYGLFIMDSYADEVTYAKDDSGRNSICIVKYWRPLTEEDI
jgi:PAS domain S-box-containing protein